MQWLNCRKKSDIHSPSWPLFEAWDAPLVGPGCPLSNSKLKISIMMPEEFNSIMGRLRLAWAGARRFPQAQRERNIITTLCISDGRLLIRVKHTGVIPAYYTHSERLCVYGPPLKMQGAVREWQGQDKRRRTDCNKNSIICSRTDN